MTLKLFTLLLLTSTSSAAFGSIIITPSSPSTTDTVTIRVENFFSSQAMATSASIVRVGNTFVVHQDIFLACTLPAHGGAISEFQVGPLLSGIYNVTADATFTGGFPNQPCFHDPVPQSAAFLVGSAIPALSHVWLLLLGAALIVTALVATSVKTYL